MLQRLEAAGALTMERVPNKRRAVLAEDGVVEWTGGAPSRRPRAVKPALDLAVTDSVRALQRMGRQVFDVAVVTGKAWGVSWSVDGRILGRAELIALADSRRAAAIAEMARAG